MQELSDHLIGTLGNPAISSEAVLASLKVRLDKTPDYVFDDRYIILYRFSDEGFEVIFDKTNGFFESVNLHLDTASIVSGAMLPYRAQLPFAIERDDTWDTVCVRMLTGKSNHEGSSGPNASSNCQCWILPPLELRIIFDADKQRIVLLSIGYVTKSTQGNIETGPAS